MGVVCNFHYKLMANVLYIDECTQLFLIKMKIRKFIKNKNADVNMILAAVIMAIVFAISIVIIFNVMSSLDTTTVDAGIGGEGVTPALNATNSLRENVEIFYTIAPIALIVVAAVGILSYVMLLRSR